MKMYRHICSIFMLALAIVACNKEVTPQENGEVGNVNVYPATLKVTIPSTKVALDGLDLIWESGDKIAVLGSGRASGPEGSSAINEFITESNEAVASFSGNVSITENEDGHEYVWYAVSPFSAVKKFNSTPTNKTVLNMPSEQTGLNTDFENCYISIAPAENTLINTSDEEYEFTMARSMTSFTSVVKVTVPEDLAVTRMTLSGYGVSDEPYGLAGDLQVRLGATGIGETAGVCKDALIPSETSVSVWRNGNIISGDVYFCVMPNIGIGTEENRLQYKNGASKVKLTLEKSNGASWEKMITIDPEHPLAAGKLLPFGEIPTTIVFAQPQIDKPILSYTEENKLVATHELQGVKFYYTTDTIGEPEDPTTASQELPVDGVELTSTQYIKVIATLDGAVSDVAEANLMYWDCSQMTSTSTQPIPAGGSIDITSWLYLTNNSATTDHSGVTIGTDGILPKLKTPYVHFNIRSKTNGTGALFVNVAYNSKRYLQSSFTTTNLTPATRTFVKLVEGDIVKDGISYVRFSNASDSGTAMFTLAFFETGDVDFPMPTCQTPDMTYGAGGVVTATSTNGATIYYTVGETVPADPTTASEIFPAEGLKIASGTYIKTLAVKDGYNNSEIVTSLVRTWKYTQLAPLFPENTNLTASGEYTSTYDLSVEGYMSDWLTLTSTSESAIVVVKGGSGYRYSSDTYFSFVNQLTGKAKLYVKQTSGKDNQAVMFRSSVTGDYGKLVSGLPDNSFALAASSAISVGETSDFYFTKGNRLDSIVLIETGLSGNTTGISNQSFIF